MFFYCEELTILYLTTFKTNQIEYISEIITFIKNYHLYY